MPKALPERRPGLSKRRSRRLRKKLHLSEFQELGFNIAIEIKQGMDGNALIDAMLSECIEPNGMQYCGLTSGFVARGYASATEADRTLLGDWLRARPEVQAVNVLPLTDAWYPDY